MCPLPSYKLQPREAITVTSEALVLRVLKYAFLIAEFVTQLQLLRHENTPLSPAAWSALLCYIYPGRLKAFCQPSPLRKYTRGGGGSANEEKPQRRASMKCVKADSSFQYVQ